MIRSFTVVVATTVLSLASLACASDPDPDSGDELRAAALWESIDGYSGWSRVPHEHEVEIHAEDLASVDGMNLSTEVEEGSLVVCEQYEQGELQMIEAFERVDHGEQHWYSVRFWPDGEVMSERFRQAVPTCGDCHGGSRG